MLISSNVVMKRQSGTPGPDSLSLVGLERQRQWDISKEIRGLIVPGHIESHEITRNFEGKFHALI